MITILIVENEDIKATKIINEVLCYFTKDIKKIDHAYDQIQAREYLSSFQYDILILDLNFYLRNKIGDTKEDAGIEILEEIENSSMFKKPRYVIGITQYPGLYEKYKEYFNKIAGSLYHYHQSDVSWIEDARRTINYAIQVKNDENRIEYNDRYQTDLCIITALPKPELTQVLQISASWSEEKYTGDSTIYHRGMFEGKNKGHSIVAAHSKQMGSTASCALAMRMISLFRPEYLIICGIAAGARSDMNFGDILIAESSFDYGSGKIIKCKNGISEFLPDPKSIPIDTDLKSIFLNIQMNNKYVDEIKNKWPADSPKASLTVHIGPFATGSAVVENDDVIKEIATHERKTIGLDMETYGVFYAATNCDEPKPKPICIKSISDFAKNKKDKYQNYASYTSTRFLFEFINEYL